MNAALRIILCTGLSASSAHAAPPTLPGDASLSMTARLGKQLFFDTNLSQPTGQACASCHDPKAAFTDPNQTQPTSNGADPQLKGGRNAPTAAYAAFSPAFHFDAAHDIYIGGQFFDGRASSLEDQAKGPFLNPLEMANPNPAAVVAKVRRARYAPLFRQVYGADALDHVAPAYQHIAEAIATFERSSVVNRFSSRYDAFLFGKAKLSKQERWGRELFEDRDKGNCAACHPSRPADNEQSSPPLFTDYSYDNLGVPKNPANPFYTLPPEFNPFGAGFVDQGLAEHIQQAEQAGKFKVPTLRNIALTAPYMHNGYFQTLRGVVEFYVSRDRKPRCVNPMTSEAQALAQQCWPAPEVAANVNRMELGDLNLNDREIDAIVAFLQTLTDGYSAQ